MLASGSSGSTLRGLGIQSFTSGSFESSGSAGVRVSSSGNTLEDLYVGTSSTGFLARPNDSGIVVTGDGNTIGPGNLVSGNSSYGVVIDGTVTGAAGNVVLGNLVGTDRTGDAPLVDDTAIAAYDAPRTIIGGPTASDGNVAVGGGIGIDVSGTIGIDNASEIRFNNVGVGKDGITAMPQSYAWAVGVGKADHVVVADNVIGHGESGLAVAGSSDVTIVRNFVGADRSGGVQPNTLQGIYLQQFGAPAHPTGIVVGGSVADGNVVRNNPWEGIILENVDATTVTGNVVKNNATTSGAGVAVTGGVGQHDLEELDRRERRARHRSRQRRLTPNDPGSGGQDADTGPNDFQNFPESLAATVTAGSVHVSGTLPSNTRTHYTVEFFVSSAADGSGNGEGNRIAAPRR